MYSKIKFKRFLPTSLSRISLVHDCSFKSQGPRLWNRVDIDIRNATNYTVFKSKLKTFLFRECYANLLLRCLRCLINFNCKILSFLCFKVKLSSIPRMMAVSIIEHYINKLLLNYYYY